ncbi:MAG: ThuA domain-containing protein, partial [Thermoguttaceae bacterium]
MANILEAVAPVKCTVYLNCVPGMPLPYSCESADCIVVYADGDGMYPLAGQTEQLEKLANRGCSFVFMHYATLPNQESKDGKVVSTPDFEFVKNASGAVYEHFWTANPFFVGKFDSFVEHPVTRGLMPFSIYDEWYFHMRFKDDISSDEILKKGAASPVVPILVCTPPDEVKSGPDGTYSGNATIRSRLGKPEIVACVIERKDGGRGFSFTGGDVHWNYAEPNYRKSLVNGILW